MYIRYKIHPNDPEATAEERSKAYEQYLLFLFVFLGSVGAVILFIYSAVYLYVDLSFGGFLFAFAFMILMSIIDFFSIFKGLEKNEKKELAKKYYLLFFGGTFALVGLIGIIVSIAFLCHGKPGIFLLICSTIGTVIVVFTVLFLYYKIGAPHRKLHLFTVKSETGSDLSAYRKPADTFDDLLTQSTFIYCHKCGNKVSSNSIFCNSCGAKLR